ncbi:MAG: hypothetical protein R3215_00310 [Halomonas sp.]|nr:hypothetical protein [Halomonas sp.]
MPLPDGVDAIWPFPPNWVRPVAERREYQTDILGSRDRTEQRRALRGKPRAALEYRVTVDRDQARRLDRMLWSLQPYTLLVPLWPRGCRLSADAALAATVLVLDRPFPGDTRVGDPLIIAPGDDTPEAATLAGISADRQTLTLADPLDLSWSAGARVYPAWPCVMPSDIRGRRRTAQVLELPLRFERLVDTRPAGAAYGAPDLEVGGVEVLLREVNWAGGLDATYDWPATLVDSGIGPQFREVLGRFAPHTLAGEVVCEGRAAVDWWQGFFDRHKGRLGQFLVPTRIDPLPLVAPTLGGIDFELADGDVGRYLPPPEVFTHLLVRKQDGSRALYEIDTITADLGADVTRITTLDPWDEAYGPEEALGTQFVMTARLASDALEITWLTDGVATFTLALAAAERIA